MPELSIVLAAFALVIFAIMVAYFAARIIAELLIQLLPQSLLPPHLRAETEPVGNKYEDYADVTNRKANR